MPDRPTVAPLGSDLTSRESEAVEAYRRTGSYDAAAAEMGITASTLREHLANARSRRGVHWTWQLFSERAA